MADRTHVENFFGQGKPGNNDPRIISDDCTPEDATNWRSIGELVNLVIDRLRIDEADHET